MTGNVNSTRVNATVFDPVLSEVPSEQVSLIKALRRAYLRSTRQACSVLANAAHGRGAGRGDRAVTAEDTATALTTVAGNWNVSPGIVNALLPAERATLSDEAVQDRLIRLLACNPTEAEARAWQDDPPTDEQITLLLSLRGLILDGVR